MTPPISRRLAPRRGRPGVLVSLLSLVAAAAVGCGTPAPTDRPAIAPTGSPGATPAASVAPAASPGSATASPAGATASPAASPSPGEPSITPTEPAAAWVRLEPAAPMPAIADLTPIGGSGPIGAGAAFELVSLSDEPALSLAARLTVEPPRQLAVAQGSDAGRAIVTPVEPFAVGSLVRFRVTRPDGALAGSWAYEVERPPHVVAVLPGSGASEVPVATGIEVAFDQDGIVVGTGDLVVDPPVSGRLETSGRVVTFVPDALAPGTVYTVTLRAGVRRPGSAFALERDVQWRFETTLGPDERISAYLATSRASATTLESALLVVERDTPEEMVPLAGGHVTVHRLADRAAAIAAARRLGRLRESFTSGRYVVVPTSGLPMTFEADVRFVTSDESGMTSLRLPRRLAAGWYLVSLDAQGTSQAVLQVTDLAPYVAITRTRTLAWVNDARRQRPADGVRVALDGGAALGVTTDNGILDIPTPETLVAAGDPTGDQPSWAAEPDRFLLLDSPDGRQAFVSIDPPCCGTSHVGFGEWGEIANATWWAALTTDRLQYRTTDTVSAWGVIRARSDRRVPGDVSLRVAVDDDAPAIADVSLDADERGAFATQIPIRDLPTGEYLLSLRVGDEIVAQTWMQVSVVRLPAYRLTIRPQRWAVIGGTPAQFDLGATFYEGTPAGGIDLAVEGEDLPSVDARTGADGTATAKVTPRAAKDSPVATNTFSVHPRSPEEGEIGADATVLVFQGSHVLSGRSRVAGPILTVTGSVRESAIERLNGLPSFEAASDADPDGTPVPGARVRIRVVEYTVKRVRTGTSYDPITKLTTPIYDLVERKRTLPVAAATTSREGKYTVRLRVAGGDANYGVTVSTTDPEGRTIRADLGVDAEASHEYRAPLEFTPVSEGVCPDGCRLDQAYRLTLRGTQPLPTTGPNRYLFMVEQAGLRSWSLTGTPVLAGTFTRDDVPGVTVDAVWFTGRGYVLVPFPQTVRVAPEETRLQVTVTTDRARYEPRDSSTLTVRVTDQAGRPVTGTLVAAVVDERYFDATGGPPVADPVEMLYRSLGDGVIRTLAFPVSMRWSKGEGGATTGGPGGDGPERSDFRDALLFTRVATDAQGAATIVVPLSDDLTGWRVAVAAVDGDLRGGVGEGEIRVGLPFFAQVTLAPEYLASDRPAVGLRAFGSAIGPDTSITFTVSSDTLPMATVTATGTAAAGVTVPLPSLGIGDHRLRITATDGTRRDSLVRTFRVMESRLTHPTTKAWEVAGGDSLRPAGGERGMTTYLVSDAGRGRWLGRLWDLATAPVNRSDRLVGAAAARAILRDTFGLDEGTLPPEIPATDAFRGTRGGFTTVPYGGSDLELTVRILLADPTAAGGGVESWLWSVADDRDDDYEGRQTPERRSVALAGLGALGQPVRARILERLGAPDVTDRERLFLGLGAAALGDITTADRVSRDLADRFGQARGDMVRLAVDADPARVTEATARWAALAAALGDPRAPAALAYVDAYPLTSDLTILEELTALRGLLARASPEQGAATWSVAGAAGTTLDLAGGRAAAITVTPAQRATLQLAATAGRVVVVGAWREPGLPPTTPSAHVQISRSVEPGLALPAGSLVRVRLAVSLAAEATRGSYRVVDLLPSGLVPLDLRLGWEGDDEDEPECLLPWSVDGQAVAFAFERGARPGRTEHLCYLARVVTTGTYRWEPGVVTADADPATWAGTGVSEVLIR